MAGGSGKALGGRRHHPAHGTVPEGLRCRQQRHRQRRDLRAGRQPLHEEGMGAAHKDAPALLLKLPRDASAIPAGTGLVRGSRGSRHGAGVVQLWVLARPWLGAGALDGLLCRRLARDLPSSCKTLQLH